MCFFSRDEGVHFGLQQGITLSKCNVLYFKHNDMEDLERVLQDVREKDLAHPSKKLHRRFVIVEGLYQNYGDITPLDKVVELKKKYKYRLLLDDTLAVGVLGATGRGSPEHFNIKVFLSFLPPLSFFFFLLLSSLFCFFVLRSSALLQKSYSDVLSPSLSLSQIYIIDLSVSLSLSSRWRILKFCAARWMRLWVQLAVSAWASTALLTTRFGVCL